MSIFDNLTEQQAFNLLNTSSSTNNSSLLQQSELIRQQNEADLFAQQQRVQQEQQEQRAKPKEGFNKFLTAVESLGLGLQGKDPRDLKTETSSLTAAQKNFQYLLTLPESERNKFLAIQGALRFDPDAARKLEESKRIGKSPGGLDLTPGQKKTDEAFSKTFNAWQFGEKQQAESNIVNLDNKLARLATDQENVSGADIGLTPEVLRPYVFPEATGFLDEINDIVYQSLRATLGPQFTENEGKRLVAATFNLSLSEEFNKPRLQRLNAKIKSIYKSKQDAINYYDENGTLAGFKQEPSSFNDILDAVYFDEFRQLDKEQILNRYKEAKTPEERQTILRFAQELDKETK